MAQQEVPDRSTNDQPTPENGGFGPEEECSQERGEDVELDLDFQRPSQDIDSARRAVRNVVQVEETREQVLSLLDTQAAGQHKEQQHADDVWRFQPRYPAKEVAAQVHGRTISQRIGSERQAEDKTAYHKEKLDPDYHP